MRIVLASSIAPDAVAKLSLRHLLTDVAGAPRARLLEAIVDADVLVVRSGVTIDAALIARATRLRLVIRAGSGTDNLDLAALEAGGIELVRVPEPGAEAVAEMTFALLLALLRNVVVGDRTVRQGRWLKSQLTGSRLAGRTLGVVGAGNIGTRVGRLGRAWGMPVLGCVEEPGPAARRRLAAAGIELCSFEALLDRSDVVSLHVPLTPATTNLLDHAAIDRMRPGSYLVSLARGGVVDELALREALVAGHLAGAALDVHASEGPGMRSPLADLPNVVLTPHIGAGTHEAQQAIGQRVVTLVESLAASSPATVVPEYAP